MMMDTEFSLKELIVIAQELATAHLELVKAKIAYYQIKAVKINEELQNPVARPVKEKYRRGGD